MLRKQLTTAATTTKEQLNAVLGIRFVAHFPKNASIKPVRILQLN